jgi:hypothetical protein
VKIFGGLVGLFLAIVALSTVDAAQGWDSWSISVLSAVFWAAVGLGGLRAGWRQWASRHEALRSDPDMERIPE